MGVFSSRDELGEIINETYLKAYHLLSDERYREIRNMSGWIRRILQFETLDYLRKKKNKKISLDELTQEEQVMDWLVYSVGENYTGLSMDEVLNEIDGEKKEIIRLYVEGYTSKEIGDRLNKGADAVRQEKRRIVEALRNRYKKHF